VHTSGTAGIPQDSASHFFPCDVFLAFYLPFQLHLRRFCGWPHSAHSRDGRTTQRICLAFDPPLSTSLILFASSNTPVMTSFWVCTQCTHLGTVEYNRILRYGACKGAPLTQRGSTLMVQERKCSHAALHGLISRAGLPKDVAKGCQHPPDGWNGG
jgi:hypothetical protein